MGGRLRARRLVTTTLPGLVIALALVLLPSMGSSLVPTAALAAAAPAATVVHLLGDEVVPALSGSSAEVRARALVRGDGLLGLLLTTAVGLLGAGFVVGMHRRASLRQRLMPLPVSSGRSPPHLHDR